MKPIKMLCHCICNCLKATPIIQISNTGSVSVIINTPGEKDKAVRYLEDAVKNINPNYREGKFKESGAPYDALYYLANAYRINNQLDKALETYDLFKRNMDTEVYDSTVVDLQIQSCLNAKELIGKTQIYKEI